MTLNDLLRSRDIDLQTVLVLHHRPSAPELHRALTWLAAENPEVFDAYQQTQGERVEAAMARSKFVASFIGREAGKALFIGLYAVGASKSITREEYWQIPAYIEMKALGTGGGIAAACERVPIRYLGVPRPADLRSLIARLALNVACGTPSYVHCWGGIGRTGTVIGCWLVEHNAMNGDEALEHISKLRRCTPDGRRRSPETDEQSALVRGWADLSRKALASGGGDSR